jgi:5-hydroxyisourate hydrolase
MSPLMSEQASPITTHVLDTARGRPADGVAVVLEQLAGQAWMKIGGGTTDLDGRLRSLLAPGSLLPGTYRLTFDTGAYFASQNKSCFYPHVTVMFAVEDNTQHYHVPLLLSPYGYSTYRGS